MEDFKLSERKYLEEDHRPWTSYYVIEDIEGLKVKRIVVKPDKRLSLQHHLRRDEHWHRISCFRGSCHWRRLYRRK